MRLRDVVDSLERGGVQIYDTRDGRVVFMRSDELIASQFAEETVLDTVLTEEVRFAFVKRGFLWW